MTLLPWQRYVAEVALEMEGDRPAYREVVVSVPRQAGKSTLVWLWLCFRAVVWERQPQMLAYTAQTGWDARRKLLQDFEPMLRASRLVGGVKRLYRSNAETAVHWRTGSRIEIVASVEDAGHGRVLDGAAIDEAWADSDDRREASLIPTMVTRPDAQLWVVSSAGTEASLYWARKVELGRDAAERGETSGLAYFEWSAPPEADSDDEELWREVHPGLAEGLISLEALRHARRTMSEPEFRRAVLNIPIGEGEERVIPAAAWEAACSLQAAPSGALRFGADALVDRSAAAIAAYGGGAAELVDHRVGVTWLRDRLVELATKHRAPVALDAQGPLAGLVGELQARGVRVIALRTADMCVASARLLDAIVDGELRIRRSRELDAAAAAVRKRPVGERWLWSRQASAGDPSPLLALAIAVGAPEEARAPVRLLRLED